MVRIRQGRLDEANPHLSEAIRRDPNLAAKLSPLGLALADEGKWSEAAYCFAIASQVFPHVAELRFNRGLALQEQGHSEEAKREYDEGLRLDPQWPRQAAQAAWTLATHPDSTRRQATAAVLRARQACQATGGRDPRYLDVLAAALAEAQQFDEATRTAEQALERARSGGQSDLALQIQDRLELYRNRKPFRDN
jgi:tetratricopeptide (TPR) repeat protein